MASNKVSVDPRLPALSQPGYAERLHTRLYEVLRDYAQALISLRNEGTAAPTTGTWKQGDFVWNTAPAEAGSASSKYVVIGWVCTVGGTPGTWLASRTLTGN